MYKKRSKICLYVKYYNERVSCIVQILKIDAEEYPDNHISYLDIARSIKSILLADLNNVLHRLTTTLVQEYLNTNGYVFREYFAAFLLKDTLYEWYLGVIEDIHQNNTIVVSYLMRA